MGRCIYFKSLILHFVNSLFCSISDMNPSILISAVIAIASVQYTEAFFGADVVTGSGALFTGGGGTHLVLASGAGIGGAAAVVGGAILLKSLVLLGAAPNSFLPPISAIKNLLRGESYMLGNNLCPDMNLVESAQVISGGDWFWFCIGLAIFHHHASNVEIFKSPLN